MAEVFWTIQPVKYIERFGEKQFKSFLRGRKIWKCGERMGEGKIWGKERQKRGKEAEKWVDG